MRKKSISNISKKIRNLRVCRSRDTGTSEAMIGVGPEGYELTLNLRIQLIHCRGRGGIDRQIKQNQSGATRCRLKCSCGLVSEELYSYDVDQAIMSALMGRPACLQGILFRPEHQNRTVLEIIPFNVAWEETLRKRA